MKKLFYIVKFEIMRFVTNWKKTLRMFLIPAVVMLLALYLFPILVNYLTTGSLGRTTVVLYNAPETFLDYADGLNMGTIYKFEEASDEIDELSEKKIEEHISKGEMAVVFDKTYEEGVRIYYDKLEKYFSNYDPDTIIEASEYPVCHASVDIYYKEDSTYSTRSQQLEEDVIQKFVDAYPDLVGLDTSGIPDSNIETNGFNPIGKILTNRIQANLRAGAIIPQIMVLMLYYCVYALSLDVFAGDRERGFLTKLIMTPVSSRTIIWGKLITVGFMAVFSSIVIYFIMFLASWLNFRNDALSLIPFGMLMLPGQLIKMLLVCATSAMMMIALCVWIIFDLQKPEDITVNLQLPLATILIELFVFLFTSTFRIPTAVEFLLPIHNGIQAISSIMLSEDTPTYLILACLSNILYTTIILAIVLKKEDFQ